MQTKWILAADSSRAKIFESLAPRADIREIENFDHPQGRASNRELNTDARPRFFGRGERGHTEDPQVDAVQHENELFSKMISDYLEQARVEHRYDRLCVIAPPKFLGLMRQNLSKETQKLIDEEIDKDLSKLDAREIETYLNAGDGKQ